MLTTLVLNSILNCLCQCGLKKCFLLPTSFINVKEKSDSHLLWP